MNYTTAQMIFSNVSGASFVGIDTETAVTLTGGKKNPQQGRVTKRTTGSNVMVFQNKSINGYAAMVARRLANEGKDPDSFELQPRKWGKRIANTPFVEHEKDGEMQYYVEFIFLKAGDVEYLLDGKVVDKSTIQGLPVKRAPSGQGGLEDQVQVRSFKLDSITKIRIDGNEYAC